MKKFWGLILFIFLISNICANCEEDQIDINSASASELEKLDGVGEKIAQYIIDARPFNDIDDMIDVYRIGDITLEKIKDQGLACVDDKEEKEFKEKTQEDTKEKEDMRIKEINYVVEEENKTIEIKKGQVINLEPKDIKGGNNFQKLDKEDYAVYGFVLFSVLLCLLFVIKWRKEKDEIE